MYYYFFIFFLLIFIIKKMSNNNFKTFLLWKYSALKAKYEIYIKKNEKEFYVKEVINLINNTKINNDKYFILNKKLHINNIDELFLIKYRYQSNDFRLILDHENLDKFSFNFLKVKDPKYLFILNNNNDDITHIINEYSGPNNEFYHKFNILNQNILKLDKDLILTKNLKIIDNNVNEMEIENIEDLFK